MLKRGQIDKLIGLLLALGAFALYFRTLAPSVATIFDDSLEFQFVLPSLGIAHPTGYPLYTMAGWLFTHIVPLGDMAYRANLFSAVGAAVAVGFFYLAVLEMTNRRAASLVATVALAVTPVFWSQATIAEVYSWQMALMAAWLWVALRWAKESDGGKPGTWLLWLAALTGMLLAHHRMSVLLLPSLAYWLWVHREGVIRSCKPVGYFTLPLLAYLYIPLRGLTTTSLDGTYQNTLRGFLQWTMASNYGVFFRENPFHVHYTPAYFAKLWEHSFGPVGLAIGVLGMILLWKKRDVWIFLMLALVLNLAFALTYKVADVQVFFLPSFLLFSAFVGYGLTVFDAIRWKPVATLLTLLFLLQPAIVANAEWSQQDRSHSWAVYDYAVDVMSQPMPRGSVIVGLLGEKTLFTYMQRFHNMRRDVTIFAQDDPHERLALVTSLADQRKHVFLTRKLAGLPEKFPLSAMGPLIQVLEPGTYPDTSGMIPLRKKMSPSIVLLGYKSEVLSTHTGQKARITLFWEAQDKIREDFKVSARLNVGRTTAFAVDDWPVHRAYPTRYWRDGDIVADCYDLKPPKTGNYEPLIVLYRARDVKEVGRATLPPILLKEPTETRNNP